MSRRTDEKMVLYPNSSNCLASPHLEMDTRRARNNSLRFLYAISYRNCIVIVSYRIALYSVVPFHVVLFKATIDPVESSSFVDWTYQTGLDQTRSWSMREGFSTYAFQSFEKRATVAPSTILWSADQLTFMILTGTGSVRSSKYIRGGRRADRETAKQRNTSNGNRRYVRSVLRYPKSK